MNQKALRLKKKKKKQTGISIAQKFQTIKSIFLKEKKNFRRPPALTG